MFRPTLTKLASILAVPAFLAAAGILAATAIGGPAVGATANLRPICNNLGSTCRPVSARK